MAVNEKNYLITGEVRFPSGFYGKFDDVVRKVRRVAEWADGREFIQRVSLNSPLVRVRVTAKSSKNAVLSTANLLENYKRNTFEQNGRLHRRMHEVMERIRANVESRFLSAGIGVRSGNLFATVLSQDVVVDANKSRIVGAVMNYKNMERELNTRSVVTRRKKATQRMRVYPYETPAQTLNVAGYWAFLDQGFVHRSGTVVTGREYILDAKGDYNIEDRQLLDSIPKMLSDSIQQLNQKTQAILRG
jgi:hypothetical protein